TVTVNIHVSIKLLKLSLSTKIFVVTPTGNNEPDTNPCVCSKVLAESGVMVGQETTAPQSPILTFTEILSGQSLILNNPPPPLSKVFSKSSSIKVFIKVLFNWYSSLFESIIELFSA